MEKSYLYHTPSKSDGRVPSKQGAPTTCNLTYWEVGSGYRAKLSTSVEGGVFRQIAHSSYLPAILSFKGHIIFPNLPAKTEKNFLKNRYFEEQIHWAPLTFVPTQKLSGTV